MVTPSKPSPCEQLLPLPTPCVEMFLERSLNETSGRNESFPAKRRILKCHIFKNRTAMKQQICIFNSVMLLITCTKFQINQIILTLFSGVWDKENLRG